MKKVLICLALISLLACEEPEQETTYFELGETFMLRHDEVAVNESEELAIRFAKIIQDSRCPENIQCVWEGIGIIKISFQTEDESADFELSTYDFEPIDLKPYPRDGVNLKNSDYQVILIVTEV